MAEASIGIFEAQPTGPFQGYETSSEHQANIITENDTTLVVVRKSKSKKGWGRQCVKKKEYWHAAQFHATGLQLEFSLVSFQVNINGD